MYCKYCGKQIQEDSVFCPHCGKRIDGEREFANKIHKNKLLCFLISFWTFVNLFLLFRGTNKHSGDAFYPFTKITSSYNSYGSYFNVEYYDITEFVVYMCIIPTVIYYYYYRRKNK